MYYGYSYCVFDTVTVVSRYTIATVIITQTICCALQGLHPESHGIINNKFYDRNLRMNFTVNGDSATQDDPRWWLAKPVSCMAKKKCPLLGKSHISAKLVTSVL